MQPNIFINQYAKGSSENGNIGIESMVGIDTYGKKGVAQLSKVNTAVTYSGGGNTPFPNLPKYIATSGSGTFYGIATVSGNCQIYVSTDGAGKIWTDTGNSISGQPASGLIFFPCTPATGSQGYYIMFAGTKVYFFQDGYTNVTGGTTPNFSVLISGEHPTLFCPFDGFIYFGNGNFVDRIGYGTATTFNPAGTLNTDFVITGNATNPHRLTLPLIYTVTCLSFLLPNYIAIGTSGGSANASPSYNPQIADIILWNPTLSTYETPLRLYSRSSQVGVLSGSTYGGLIQSGIVGIVNRNNTLYALTAGNFALYETNGVNFSLIADFSLRSNIRLVGGTESNLPVFIAGYSPAMAVIGNKILIGISTPNSPNYPTNYGLFPCGVWTVAFSDNGGTYEISFGINGTAIQCEYPISTLTTVATSNVFQIGCIFPIGGNSALISWADNTSFGMDYIETNYYQNSSSAVAIESQMMEIGTPLVPNTVGNLGINLVRNLMTGQKFYVQYRTAFDQDYSAVVSPDLSAGAFTGDGTKNSYVITGHQIGQTRYLQFRLIFPTTTPATNATTATYTPQLRNFIIGNPQTK